MGELRESKKQATRERISDVATALFHERGFDAVTIEEIAQAAKVSKMTVTNYFARKEELMLDREDDLKLVPLRAALRERPRGQSLVDTVRAHLRGQHEQRKAIARIDHQTVAWWRVVTASAALRSRLRELADEAAEGLAIELAGPEPDGRARLLGALIVLTVRTAREEAIRLAASGASAKKVSAAFLAQMEVGLAAVQAVATEESRAGGQARGTGREAGGTPRG